MAETLVWKKNRLNYPSVNNDQFRKKKLFYPEIHGVIQAMTTETWSARVHSIPISVMSAGDHMETVATDTYIVAFKCPYKL